MENGNKEVYYKDYLALGKVLDAQYPESNATGQPAHDEMLFIIIHQAYELWFKQIIHELHSVQKIFSTGHINDNAPDMQIAVHRLKRVVTIQRVLVHQIDILETMTPLDFLDFRNLLSPASGFQSFQFKMVEAMMGLKFSQRYEQNYYTSALKPDDLKTVKDVEKEESLLDLVNQWLERMPFFNERYWKEDKDFWLTYREHYNQSLSEAEKNNLEQFDRLLLGKNFPEGRSLSAAANRSALFIMLYRDYPLMQLPFQLINTLLDLDEQMATWRYRHINVVHRMIGTRIGTGGSSGKDYLQGAMNKHYVYKDFADLTSFMIERRNLPELHQDLTRLLSYTLPGA